MRVVCAILGPIAVRAGWRAWTGQWREWAHPLATWGYLPLLYIPIGLALVGIALLGPDRISAGDYTLWQFAVLAVTIGPMVIVGPLMTLGLFWTPKHLPDRIRPRWLSPDWEVPKFRDPRAVGIMSLSGPMPSPTSEELAAEVAQGSPRLGRWSVYHVEENPAVPYLNLGIPGMRHCYLTICDHAVVISQNSREDRIHQQPFVIAFRPGQVVGMRFEPGRRWSSQMFHRAHHTFPRLYLETASETHELALQRVFLGRQTWDLTLLERVLRVPVER